jgi:hypothetical protein
MLFNPEAVLYWEWGLKWDVSYGVVGEVTNDVTKSQMSKLRKTQRSTTSEKELKWAGRLQSHKHTC